MLIDPPLWNAGNSQICSHHANLSNPKFFEHRAKYLPLDVGSVFEETVKDVVGQRSLKGEGHGRGSEREGIPTF
jgi:hypothetical protein